MKTVSKLLSLFGLLSISFCLMACQMGMGGSTTTSNSISFVTNGGSEIAPMKNVTSGDSIKLPTPTKDGFLFAGWFLNEDLSGSKLPSTYTYSSPVVLYASWFPLGYTITIVSNEVELSEDTYSYKFDQEINIPTPKSDYFDFVGFFKEDGTPFTLTKMPSEDITIYAKWQGKAITVTLDLNGGVAPSGFVSSHSIISGDTIELLNPTKEGYLFKGWYDDMDHKYTSNTKINKTTTLKAKWDSLSNYQSTYNVTYVTNGGTLTDASSTYNVGSTTVLPTPTKTNATFLGWYESPIFYGEKQDSISNTTIGDKTFYAKWQNIKESYVVKFIFSDGTSEDVTVNHNSLVTKKALSSDLSWYKGNELFDFNTKITEDITLYANFSILSSVLSSVIPTVFKENQSLPTTITSDAKQIRATYSSSDQYTLTNQGVTNPKRVDSIVNLSVTFTYNQTKITQVFDVIVPKVELKDLNNGKPVFGYVYASSYKGFTDTAKNTLEVVNVAFGRVTDESTVSVEEIERFLLNINQIRKSGVRVVLSIGGADPSSLSKFSNTAFTAENRKKFALSILEVIEKYHLDGVDVDWEYPGYNTGRDVSIDRANYTILMATIYQTLKDANSDYLVTAALPGGKYGIDRYSVGQVSNYLDYIHLMTYDFHDSTRAFHHTALYGSEYTADKANVHDSVNLYIERGAPSSKIVVGIAFYGRVYTLSGSHNVTTAIGSYDVVDSGKHMTYTDIYNFMKVNKDIEGSYQTFFDSKASATVLYIPSEKKLVSFDNPNSIKAKCNYVWNRDLGGVMYWENGEDTTDVLLKAIEAGMKK